MRICFVCLGNICRSPAAEGVFAHLATDVGLVDVEIDSAGTSDYHLGERPHASTRAEAARRGITIDHRGRQFVAADFDRFDLVVAMDRANERNLRRLAPDDKARAKVVLLGAFATDSERSAALDVPDPWGLDEAAYAAMFDQLVDACAGLLRHVLDRRSP